MKSYLLNLMAFAAFLSSPQAQSDWGDAPDAVLLSGYPTLASHDGASHVATGPRLGSLRDTEANGLPNATATGDDVNNTDDEDGVSLPTNFVRSDSQRIVVSASGAGFLNAWVDWNQDQTWQATEMIATNRAVVAGVNNLIITVPANATVGQTFARFRLTSANVATPLPTGALPSGEVEDYAINVISATDLRLSMSVSDSNLALNEQTIVTLTLTNSGPISASGINVQCTIPAGLAVLANTLSVGTFSSSTGLWTVGSLAATAGSNTATLTLTLNATASNATPTLYAEVSAASVLDPDSTVNDHSGRGQVGDPTHQDDDGSAGITIQTLSDLALNLTVIDATISLNQTTLLTLALSNQGPSNASSMTVKFLLPSGLTFVSGSPSVGTYNSVTGIWTVSNLASGATATLSITARANITTGNPSLYAEITGSSNPDPDSTVNDHSGRGQAGDPGHQDDDVSQVITISNVADLSLTLTSNLESASVLENVTFTLALNNQGPADASVVVKFQLPAGMSFVSQTSTQGTYALSNGNWTAGSVLAGATATLTLTAQPTGSAGTRSLYAQVTSSDRTDPDSTVNDNSGRGVGGDPAHQDDDTSLTLIVTSATGHSISGTVRLDLNRDGILTANEPPLSGARIDLRSGANLLTSADADSAGAFVFTNRNNGTYQFGIGFNSLGLAFTATPAPVVVNGASVSGVVLAIAPGESSSAEGFVREFLDGDRLNDDPANVVPIQNASLTMVWSGPDGDINTAADNVDLGTVQTSVTGAYRFTHLPPGLLRLALIQASLPSPMRPLNFSGDTVRVFKHTFADFLDFDLTRKNQIFGEIWIDLDGDGLKDDDNVAVVLRTLSLQMQAVRVSDNQVAAQVEVSNEGTFLMTPLAPGTYFLRMVGLPAGYSFSPVTPDDLVNAIAGNDFLGTAQTGNFTITTGADLRIDAGLRVTGIGGQTYTDADGDGVSDGNEFVLPGVTVRLFNSGGTQIAGPIAANNGWFFPNLAPGSYFVRYSIPAGLSFAPQDQGTDEQLDSDVNAGGQTALIPVVANEISMRHADAILLGTGITGYAWFDRNANSGPDEYDFLPFSTKQAFRPLAGVTVRVVNANTFVESSLVVTAADGHFAFYSMTPGSYFLRAVSLPGGFALSPKTDTQSVDGQGVSEVFDLTAGSLREPNFGIGAHRPSDLFVKMDSIELLPGEIRLRLSGPAGARIGLQTSEDLLNWLSANSTIFQISPTPLTGNGVFQQNVGFSGQHSFYRGVLNPSEAP